MTHTVSFPLSFSIALPFRLCLFLQEDCSHYPPSLFRSPFSFGVVPTLLALLSSFCLIEAAAASSVVNNTCIDMLTFRTTTELVFITILRRRPVVAFCMIAVCKCECVCVCVSWLDTHSSNKIGPDCAACISTSLAAITCLQRLYLRCHPLYPKRLLSLRIAHKSIFSLNVSDDRCRRNQQYLKKERQGFQA